MDFEKRYKRDDVRPSHTPEGRQIFMDDHHFLDLQRRFVDNEPDLFSTETTDYYASHRSKVKEMDEREALRVEQEKKERADAAARERLDKLERDLPRVRVVEPGEARQSQDEQGVTGAYIPRTGGS